MKKQRKHYTPEEKVAILRRHLVEGAPISDLCNELGLQPTVFYPWQKEFFENRAAAFQQRGRTNHQPEQERIAYLEQKIQTKDEVWPNEGNARRASAGDSGRAGSKVGSGEGTAEESPPAGRVTDETDYFRFATREQSCAIRRSRPKCAAICFQIQADVWTPAAREQAGGCKMHAVFELKSGTIISSFSRGQE